MCGTGLLTACEQDQDGIPSWSCSQARHRNCLEHVQFYSKNKFEKLVQLVGFIIRREPKHVVERNNVRIHLNKIIELCLTIFCLYFIIRVICYKVTDVSVERAASIFKAEDDYLLSVWRISSVTSINFYHAMRRHIPDDRILRKEKQTSENWFTLQ